MACAFVTGASGFIGQVLCRRLQQQGVRVRALVRGAVTGPWDETVTGDLTGVLPPGALRGVDSVFHLAGKAHALSETRQDGAEYFTVNTDGTRKLLEAAAAERVNRFILFSSVKAMGEGAPECLDESYRGEPVTPYGRSKRAAERLVLDGDYVPHPVVLRLSMVYGATGKGNLPRMIEAVARGRFPPLAELGNRRSMVHVDDVARAALLCAQQARAAGQIYIVTDGKPCSTRELYEWIRAALNRPVASRLVVPHVVLRLVAKVGDGIGRLRGRRFLFDSDALEKLTGSACYSSAKIQRDLGFRPERDLRGSLPEIVAWLGLE
jgi:nucleoside-diphosphate-sugar epimerase